MSKPDRVLVGISGGIAAYKLGWVISQLSQAGVEVRAILTDAAQAFISPLTVATLSRHPAYTDDHFWQADQGRPLHISLGEWAEVFLIAPLTAQTLAKLAYGLADNLLTNTVLASTCPVLVAPAMNTDMWQQPVVQRNWQMLLQDQRFHGVGPGQGRLACDRLGAGRMAEPDDLISYLHSLLHSGGKRDLEGRCLLISAGSTQEYLDPVRFIGNPSTGKMGVALALAAHHRGARVVLVHGPMEQGLVDRLAEIETHPVVSAAAMHQAMVEHLARANWIVMAAAVADVKPATLSATKLAKGAIPPNLALEPVADILLDLARRRQPQQKLIGFAAQTGEIVAPALEKLHRKGLDAIVANPVDQLETGFGRDTNQAVLICGDQQITISPCTKLEMAHRIFDYLVQKY
ncbi:MAG: bifunctional phosphopantothenoylcysteine decarboxylase/phosphopantothenate--cysteine ligase CoaBC [Cyanobacteria bacterium REEB459]|nr:bifunctional phosphopantothenoylcysteine decarboxylase/phosphopantothenate--cysteine ligase CoaBC [Cyanobacteria bacterium REEB459]